MPTVDVDANLSTVADYLDWLDRTRRRTPATVSSYSRVCHALAEWAGDRHVLDLTLGDLEAFVLRRRPRVAAPSPATQRLETAVIRSLFKWAGTRGRLRQDDPTPLLSEQAPSVRNERPKPVPSAAWRAVWGGDLSDSERVALGLGYFCGLRRGEILGLTAEQVDWEARLLRGVLRKGGMRRDVRWGSALDVYEARMPEALVDPEWFTGALRRRQRAEYRWLIGWPAPSGPIAGSSFNKRLARLCRERGVDQFSPHQLRHSFCTNLIAVGIPLQVVSRLANHQSLQVTMRYVELGEDPLAQFV